MVIVERKNHSILNVNGRARDRDWVMLFTLCDGKIVRNWHY